MKHVLNHRLINLCLLALVWCLFPLLLSAQTVTVNAEIDSLQIFIGEQAHVSLEVSCDAGSKVEFPVFGDTLVQGIEIVDILQADTQYLNENKRMLISQQYTITSFDSAFYYLPPFTVKVDDKEYLSESLALMVYTLNVDVSQPDAFYGPNSIWDIKLTWSDWRNSIILFLLILFVVAVIVYLIIRYRDNKPIIRSVKVEPKLPPHQHALLEIERIKKSKNWQGDSKVYYTELTDVIRTYIKERFDYNALEKTSAEIISFLQGQEAQVLVDELQVLFETADLVKFAKHIPLLNENDMNLVNAIDFINQTKVEVDPNVKQPQVEVTIEEKRSQRAKLFLAIGIGTLVVVALFLLVFLGNEIYNLFFN